MVLVPHLLIPAKNARLLHCDVTSCNHGNIALCIVPLELKQRYAKLPVVVAFLED